MCFGEVQRLTKKIVPEIPWEITWGFNVDFGVLLMLRTSLGADGELDGV